MNVGRSVMAKISATVISTLSVPIPVETTAGREEYVREQRVLAVAAIPLRDRLIGEYQQLFV